MRLLGSPPVPTALPDASTPPSSPWDVFTVRAIGFLVFLVPFDGFGALTRAIGVSIPTLAGYVVLVICASRLPAIIRVQPIAFWAWCTTFAMGTLLAVSALFVDGSDIGYQLTTGWQMLGLMALTAFAVSSQHGGERVMRSFMMGVVATMVLYVVLYRLNVLTVRGPDRVRWVAGMQANQAGLSGAIGLLLILTTWSAWGKKARQLLLFVGAPACLYALALCNSRGANLAIGVGLLALLIPSRRAVAFSRVKLAVTLGVALTIVGAALGLSGRDELVSSQMDRWSRSTVEIDAGQMRGEILSASFYLARENPWGYGIGGSQALIARRVRGHHPIVDAHNEYLRVLLDCGFVGLLAFLYGHTLLLREGWRRRREDGDAWPLAILLAIQVFSLSHSAGYNKITWIVAGAVAGLSAARSRERARATTRAPSVVAQRLPIRPAVVPLRGQ